MQDELHPNLVEQIRLEDEAWNSSIDKYDKQLAKMIENGSIGDSKEVILIMKATIDTLSTYISKYYKSDKRGNHKKVQLFLQQTLGSADNVAYMLIKTVFSLLLQNNNCKALLLSKGLVKALSSVNAISIFKQEHPKLFSYVEIKNKRRGEAKVKEQKQRLSRKLATSTLSGEVSKLLGTTCIELVLNSGCGLIVQKREADTSISIALSEQTKALFLRSKMFFGSVLTSYYPLVYPPKQWNTIDGTGGYYTQRNISFIKTRNRKDMQLIQSASPDLQRLMTVVNKIQETPYTINKRVLNVIKTITKYNLVNPDSHISNPVLYGDIPYMETMKLHDLVLKEDYGKLGEDGRFISTESKKRWMRALEDQETKIQRIESKRLAFKMAVEVAERFSKYDKIYYSYTLDFRGRLYPVQNFLHPQSSDNIKSMLQFANGQILNDKGVWWLKIHGANCYGYDKLTYEERVAKIEEMNDEITLIRRDPIANIKLWYNADSPLLFLAFCFAYGDWLENNQTPIHIAVQLDGTCSGIQMYSGLLLDAKGARSVNVLGGSTVNDIYKDVAEVVERYLNTGDYPRTIEYTTKDGEKHVRNTDLEAVSLRGKINRKLTKRNVMTQPYSVTDRGMYEQLYELLSEYEDSNKVFWSGDKWVVATLLAKLNAKAIGEVVEGATRGQKFIKAVLRASLKEADDAFWFTPIFNFPVLQRIKRETKQRLRTPLGDLVLYHPTDETHYMRMLNGIAPNFIHSLDATLLYRTVERCIDRGVDNFWLIHDSYGVPPNDAEILSIEVREAFIELFESKPLKDWTQQILPSGVDVVDKVMINTLDLQDVRESKYLFS